MRIPPQRIFDERLDVSEVAPQELFFHDGGGERDETDAADGWQTGVAVPRQSFLNLEAITRHHYFLFYPRGSLSLGTQGGESERFRRGMKRMTCTTVRYSQMKEKLNIFRILTRFPSAAYVVTVR